MEKDHLEIVLEDIRGKFELVLEGHDGLRKEIQDTRQELCEKVNLVDFKVEALNQKIDSVEDKLIQKIDSVKDKLDKKIDSVKDRLIQKIDTLESSIKSEIQGVEKKVAAAAADLSAHRADTEVHTKVYKVSE